MTACQILSKIDLKIQCLIPFHEEESIQSKTGILRRIIFDWKCEMY